MPRPTTKKDLIEAAESGYKKLFTLIDSMSDKEQNATFCFDMETAGKEEHWKRDKNIRDVLIHLYEWHLLLLSWVSVNIKGEEKSFLPEPYTWKTYGQMNREFFEKHQSTKYEKSKLMLNESHKEVLELISTFTNEQLFEKNQYKWTGTTTLGSYCVSATASHYDWALKKIKKQVKALKGV